MPRLPSTARWRKALSDLVSRDRCRQFSPMSMLLGLAILVSGCAAIPPAPGESAADDGYVQIAQAMRMAESVKATGDMAAAAVFYRRAHALAPDKLEPLLGLAQSAAAAGANEQAAQFYRQAVALAPDDAQVRLGYGRVLLALDRPELAAAELRAAIAVDPSDYRTYLALGVALDVSCDQRQAQQVYRDGLLHHPGNNSLRNNLALSLAFSGDSEEAIGMLSELSRELGSAPRVRQNLALVYSLAGRAEDAAAIAQRDFSGARLRHSLALYESLRGVDGPRLAADVMCGRVSQGLLHSGLSHDRRVARSGRMAGAGERAIAAAHRSDGMLPTDDNGSVPGIGTGRAGEKQVQSPARSVNLAALDNVQAKDGSPGKPSVVSYTVRQGDTLSMIAKKYYGSARKYVALLEANSSTLAHPDKIYPGMVVNIPGLG